MRSTLAAFLNKIDKLEIFLKSIEERNNAFKKHKDPKVRNYLSIHRQLDYSAFFITLYSAFEAFIEDLAWEYIEIESSRKNYQELSESLRKKHLQKSGHLLYQARLGQGRYSHITEKDVIDNLYICLSGQSPYQLNSDAVVYHEHNLRANEVQDIFCSLGIRDINQWVSQTESLSKWFSTVTDIDPSTKRTTLEKIIEYRFDDLVQRRNDIAHKGVQLEVLDPDVGKEKLDFFKAYANSLLHILSCVYLDSYYVKTRLAAELGRPLEGPYKEDYVVVVRKPSCRVFQGQPILGSIGNKVDRWGIIKEIQINDNSVEIVEVDSLVTELGLRADFKFTRTMQIYAIDEKDEIVWD